MDTFDARAIAPSQGGGAHPPGMFDFSITGTYGKATKDGSGGMLVVEFSSPAGRIESRYNLWNSNAQAVEIAQKELSALCHCVGIFNLSFPKNPDGSPNLQMAAAELRGGRGRMEIAPQKNNPDYMEIKKVLDVNGGEPWKTGGATNNPPQVQQTPPPPMQPGPNGWGANQQPAPQASQPAPQPAPAGGNGWGNNAAPPAATGGAAQPPWGR